MRLVLRGSVQQLVVGLTAGLVLGLLVARSLGAALMGADACDWRAYVATGVTLLVTGVVAAWLPARPALRTAPTEVLRAE